MKTQTDAFTQFYNSQLEKFFKDNQLGLFNATELNDNFFSETDKVRNGLENIHVQSQLEKVGKRFKKVLQIKFLIFLKMVKVIVLIEDLN